MAIIIQYKVEHKGVEKLVTTDKKEADQYDKMLEIADNLALYLEHKGVSIAEEQMEELSILLSKNKDAVSKLLKGADAEKILEEDKADVVALDRKQA